jgi:Xaa-Pro aminopeptidase
MSFLKETTLSYEGCSSRRQALLERFPDADLLLVSQPQHIFYLSGFFTLPTELAGWGINFLLINHEGHSRLLVDNWAAGAAHSAFVDEADVWPWYDFSGPAHEKYAASAQNLTRVLEQKYTGAKRIAVEHSYLTLAASEALQIRALREAPLADLGPSLIDLRRTKHDDELACIRRAIRATEAGHAAARKIVRPGLTELEIYAEIQAAITKAAGEPITMLGDFAAGQRSEAGGGPPTKNVLNDGDLIILDLFPIIGGYRADITNTLSVGRQTQEQRDHIAVLRSAMASAETKLKPGRTGAEVYEACLLPIQDAGLGDAFPHHAGHGLGLGHPEPPYFVKGSQDILRIGDVVTLEPGAYVSGWGGARIEHNYLITEDGFERLSNHKIGL